MIALVERAAQSADSLAIVDPSGSYTYGRLLAASARAAAELLDGAGDLQEQRIAMLIPPGFEYVAVQWGIWRAGGMAVPLGLAHPGPELEYVLDDADVAAIVVAPALRDRVDAMASARSIRVMPTDPGESIEPVSDVPLPKLEPARRAMMLYTSGTTSRPKGVVTTHANIAAQVASLVEAWEWTADDRILHVLPLHHIHGIINVLACAMWSGAVCEFLSRFDARAVWRRLAGGELTLFMAVPTVYSKLIEAWEQAEPGDQTAWSNGCAALRLMVSGSAALPVSTLERWREISGHVLLERYGMTEIGMALSNPLHGTRMPGHVGTPLPGVELRLAGEQGEAVEQGQQGEIEVRGPAVFAEYWRRPEATTAAFRDGWFRTGDMAIETGGVFRILGRTSIDILKTGGYKVSALEIEEVLRTHPDIHQCAVVGIDDREWGQKVAAGVVLVPGRTLTIDTLRDWAKQRLAPYKAPTLLLILDDLPRNAMGKVVKPELTRLFG